MSLTLYETGKCSCPAAGAPSSSHTYVIYQGSFWDHYNPEGLVRNLGNQTAQSRFRVLDTFLSSSQSSFIAEVGACSIEISTHNTDKHQVVFIKFHRGHQQAFVYLVSFINRQQ